MENLIRSFGSLSLPEKSQIVVSWLQFLLLLVAGLIAIYQLSSSNKAIAIDMALATHEALESDIDRSEKSYIYLKELLDELAYRTKEEDEEKLATLQEAYPADVIELNVNMLKNSTDTLLRCLRNKACTVDEVDAHICQRAKGFYTPLTSRKGVTYGFQELMPIDFWAERYTFGRCGWGDQLKYMMRLYTLDKET